MSTTTKTKPAQAPIKPASGKSVAVQSSTSDNAANTEIDAALTHTGGRGDGEREIGEICDQSAKVTIAPAIAKAFTKMRENGILSKATKAARAQAAFQTIRLTMAPQIEAMLTLQEMLVMGKDPEVRRKPITMLFSPTGVGKSTTAGQFEALTMDGAEEGTIPVLNVRLGSSGSALQFYEAMLTGAGEDFPTSKDTTTLRHRTIETLNDVGTVLVILDETQHSEKGSGFGSAITAELKLLVDTGGFSIALLGTEKAKAIVMRDRELVSRLIAPCSLDPLVWHDDDDRETWIDMLSQLEAEMLRLKLTTGEVGLCDEEVAEALCTACSGTIGQLMCVIQHALKVAIYSDRDQIDLTDIAVAVDDWSIALDFTSDNPIWALLND